MWYNICVNNRDYKEFTEGEIYHIYNRGVNKMNIFLDEQDFRVFAARLKENLFPELINPLLSKHAVRRKTLPPNSYDLISYCLMPNHFHLLIKQNTNLPITQLILKVCTGYSKYFNKKYGRIGAIFQDRFKSVRIHKNNQLLWVSYYIHKNPIEAGFVENPNNYKWSSFSEYVKSESEPLCKKDLILSQFQKLETYLSYFKKQKTNKILQANIISNSDLLIDLE
jgi:putative transposase